MKKEIDLSREMLRKLFKEYQELINRENMQLMIGWPAENVTGITRIRNQKTLDLILLLIIITYLLTYSMVQSPS